MFLVSGEVTEMSSQICLKKIYNLKMLEICRIIGYSMIRCWQINCPLCQGHFELV